MIMRPGALEDRRRARPPAGLRQGVRRLASYHADAAVADVAHPALPVGFHVLAEIIENEARSALRALTVGNHRAQLGAVLLPAMLVVGEALAQVDRRELVAEPLPTAAAVFADQPVPLEQHEHDARLAPGHAGFLRQVVEQHRLAQGNLLENDADARRLLDVGGFATEEGRLDAAV